MRLNVITSMGPHNKHRDEQTDTGIGCEIYVTSLARLFLLRNFVFSLMDRNVNRRTSLLLPHKEIVLVKKLSISIESEVSTSKYEYYLKSMPH